MSNCCCLQAQGAASPRARKQALEPVWQGRWVGGSGSWRKRRRQQSLLGALTCCCAAAVQGTGAAGCSATAAAGAFDGAAALSLPHPLLLGPLRSSRSAWGGGGGARTPCWAACSLRVGCQCCAGLGWTQCPCALGSAFRHRCCWSRCASRSLLGWAPDMPHPPARGVHAHAGVV